MELNTNISNLSIISGDLPELKTVPVPEFNPHIDDSDLAKNKLSELKQMRDRKFNKMKNMDLDWYTETDPKTKVEIKTKLKPLPGNFNTVLADPELCNYAIAYDSFLGKVVIRDNGAINSPWIVADRFSIQAIRDVLSKDCRFTSVPFNEIQSAIEYVARNNQIDTLQEYMDATIPEWDGVPRVDQFFRDYCGAEDSEYSTVLGRYTFGMLWARGINPDPVKADICPVLIGAQGIRKSSFVEALALERNFFQHIDFQKEDKELAKLIRGRTVIEVPEMVGLTKRQAGELKAFLALDTDVTRVLYSDDQFYYVRRCLIFMTTNKKQFLDDPTGNRRYAPIEVTRCDEEMLKRDLLQLYAEGRVIFERDGGKKLHEDVEAITQYKNAKYNVAEAWTDELEDILEVYGNKFISLQEVKGKLGFEDCSRFTQKHRAQLDTAMDKLGWEPCRIRLNNHRLHGWKPKGEMFVD